MEDFLGKIEIKAANLHQSKLILTIDK